MAWLVCCALTDRNHDRKNSTKLQTAFRICPPLASRPVNQAWRFRGGRMRAAQPPAHFGTSCREMLQHPSTNAQGQTPSGAGWSAVGAVRDRLAERHRHREGASHVERTRRPARDAGDEVATARRNEVWAVSRACNGCLGLQSLSSRVCCGHLTMFPYVTI